MNTLPNIVSNVNRHECRTMPANVAAGILDSIGDTPVVAFDRYLDDPEVELYVKIEASNPGGSAKDRPALRMIETALSKGFIKCGDTIIESSSGNMGIGLAQVCRYHGLKFICVVDPNAQSENVAIIEALGGQIELVSEPENGSLLAARLIRVSQLRSQITGSYWPNQYSNLENPHSHEFGTAAELDDTFEGNLDYLFVATSSTGTARGCQDLLRRRGRSTRVIAVDALGSCLFNGTAGPRKISGMGAGIIPDLARGNEFSGVIRVSDKRCVIGCRRSAQREAFLPGGSGGGVLEAIRSVQKTLRGSRVAAILHDSGTRYLKTIYNDEWVSRELNCSIEDINRMVTSPAYE